MLRGGKGEQLHMFEPAGSLRGRPSLEVSTFPDPSRSQAHMYKELWEDKEHDNQSGYKGDVADPVSLTTDGSIADGHHRIQLGFDKSPSTELPVKHV